MLLSLLSQASIADSDVSNAPLEIVLKLFPTADVVKAKKGDVAAQAVFEGDILLGYVFFTDEIFPIPAYSGRPIRALVGVSDDGVIRGVRIVSHEEPILVIGVSDEHLANYINQYAGLSSNDRVKVGGGAREGFKTVDGITGATITAMVLHRSVMESVRKVVASRQLSDVTPQDESAIWVQNWEDKFWQIVILITGLFLLTLMLFFQDWLVVRSDLFRFLRIAYLIYTLVFIGYACLAQLSIVNILTFGQVMARGFTWETFLVDPFIFVLWSYVAFSLLLWGRGVYCGWLCPFGALQELIQKLSEKLKIKHYDFPAMVHERLWALKYMILMALIGLSLNSIKTVAPFIEVEPFKTVFSLRFQREWWFVIYALGLVVLAIFNTKLYCKYLCPLGAALSIGTRFRIFDWLRRRKECGSPCHTCAAECSVGAIKATGEIIENECHYCLECQTTYWDEHKCPAMVAQRERRERRERRITIVAAAEVE